MMFKRYLISAGPVILLLLFALTPVFAQPSEAATQSSEVVGKRLVFADGTTLDVDDAWKQGDDVFFSAAVPEEEAKKKFPKGWKSPKPYFRIVEQPK